MKVLQLCNKPSRPSIDGGCIAIDHISQGLLQNDVDLKVLTLSTHKHPFNKKNYASDFVKKTEIEGVFVDTKLNVVDAFSNLVTSDSYNISRFFSTDFDKLLQIKLSEDEFDIVHLESLFMTPYIHTIRRFSKAKIVLRSHNLEYMIWQRLAAQSGNPAKKIYLKILSSQLKKYEIGIFNDVDAIAAISREDEEKYKSQGFTKPTITIPFGVDISKYNPVKQQNSEVKLFHIGAMDWKPNIEAISWFLTEVWPKCYVKCPDLKFELAGRNMPDWLLNEENPNVINRGEVPNAVDFMNEHNVMVVPLLSAGGMRIKIIEAMALGKVVIASSIAAEGISYMPNKNIIIANTPDEFVAAILFLNDNPQKIQEIGANARKFIEEEYDENTIIKKLISFYKDLI